MKAIEYWAQACFDGKDNVEKKLPRVLLKEPSTLLSVVFERGCNLSCQHCFYQKELSSEKISTEKLLHETIVNIAQQMPESGSLVHAGRIFSPVHLKTLSAVRLNRPDLGIGMIDNGLFVGHLPFIKEQHFFFDWLDVSLDGDEKAHNLQRQNPKAYKIALEGIQKAREIARKVTSLMTLTKINYASVEAVGKLALSGEVDEIHFTPMTSCKREHREIEMGADEILRSFYGIVNLSRLLPGKIFFRLYQIEDLIRLASALGRKKVWDAFDDGFIDTGKMIANIEGVETILFPYSLWPQEEFLIDADAMCRFTHSGKFRLEEYQRGGNVVESYESNQLTPKSVLKDEYKKAVQKFWLFHGQKAFCREVAEIRQLMKKAGIFF